MPMRWLIMLGVAAALMVATPVQAGPAGHLPAFVNEFSQGANGFKEWFELLVVQDGLDLRNWGVGDYDGGSYHPLLEFKSVDFWASVPAGTLIVVYNGGDMDPVVLAAGAPNTNKANRVLLIDALDTNLVTELGMWPGNGQFGNTNTDDTPALRNAFGAIVHNLAGAHPTPFIPTPGSGTAVQFIGGPSNDVFDPGAWHYVPAAGATPGAGNGDSNSLWITALRAGGAGFPPLLYPAGDFTVREGFPLLFVLVAEPTDGQPVTLSASNLPTGALFDVAGTTGIFAWAEAGPMGVYTSVFLAADSDGVTVVTSVINVVTNPLEARFVSDWLWMEEGVGPATGRLEVVLNKSGDGSVHIAITGTASIPADAQVFPTSLVFTADGPTSQWITVIVESDTEVEGPEWLDLELIPQTGMTTASPSRAHLRIRDHDSVLIAAANLSSQVNPCNPQYADVSRRLLRGLSPDVLAVQEFKIPDAGGYPAFVEEVFGPGWHVMVENTNSSCDLPNGIISRWPITASGEWNDYELGDRDFPWATIALPGGRKLHVISVHFKAGDGTTDRQRRENQARQITNYVAQMGWPADDYLVLAGDLNQASRNESALAVLTTVFSDALIPTDQLGDPDTNIPRSRPYDYVLPNPALESAHRPLSFGGSSFPNGLVFDSRMWDPPPAPVRPNDSAEIGVQHLGVLKLFALIPPAPEDQDGDGIPDAWELLFFADLGAFGNGLDYDGDGISDWAEFRAGTNPTNASSYLRLTAVARTPNPHIEVQWSSESNRFYNLWRSERLDAPFSLVYSNLPATPPLNSVLDDLPESAASWFYWIEVQ